MTAVVFAALIWQVVDFLKELRSSATRVAALTQAIAWAVAIGFVWLGGQADATKALVLPGTELALGNLDAGSVVFVGLLTGSLGSSLVDTAKAITGRYAPPSLDAPT